MFHRIHIRVTRRTVTAAAISFLLLVLVAVTFSTGFAADTGTALSSRLWPCIHSYYSTEPPGELEYGPESLEERIVNADVIARAKLLSMSSGVEETEYEWRNENGEWVREFNYVHALYFRFQVLEYLKGGGGGELIGIVVGTERFNTRLAAGTMGGGLSEIHDHTWDSSEAIVFLKKFDWLISTRNQDRYWFGLVVTIPVCGGHRIDYYSFNSRHRKAWLPEARLHSGGTSEGEVPIGEQSFLTGAEPEDIQEVQDGNVLNYQVADSGYNAALGASGQSPTMTLSYLKGLIAELEAEIAAGDGSE